MITDERLSRTILSVVRDVADYPQPGIVFKGVTPVLADAGVFAEVVEGLAAPYRQAADRIDVVVGIEARGFILAAPVALALGVGFVPVRKQGKLPCATARASYALEYGTAEIEIHLDGIQPGQRVLVIDDVLATGGTAAAACELVERIGGVVDGLSVLMELSFLGGRSRLPGRSVHALTVV